MAKDGSCCWGLRVNSASGRVEILVQVSFVLWVVKFPAAAGAWIDKASIRTVIIRRLLFINVLLNFIILNFQTS
jgi:hypothetical protein